MATVRRFFWRLWKWRPFFGWRTPAMAWSLRHVAIQKGPLPKHEVFRGHQ